LNLVKNVVSPIDDILPLFFHIPAIFEQCHGSRDSQLADVPGEAHPVESSSPALAHTKHNPVASLPGRIAFEKVRLTTIFGYFSIKYTRLRTSFSSSSNRLHRKMSATLDRVFCEQILLLDLVAGRVIGRAMISAGLRVTAFRIAAYPNKNQG